MTKSLENLATYGDLKEFLKNWKSLEDEDIYDFGGIVHLWLACLDNIRNYAVEGELEDLGTFMLKEQREFLLLLSGYVESYEDDEDDE